MATIEPTYSDVVDGKGGQGHIAFVVSWALMANGDVGKPLPKKYAAFVDRTFQVEGTFGAGGSVAVQGSNADNDTGSVGTYRALTDPQGTTIAITAAGIKQVTEACANMRPAVTAGDGTTSLTVTAFVRRAMR